jgi:hypothetical protein
MAKLSPCASRRGVAQSEDLDEAAKAEFERIVADKPGQVSETELIRVGKSAAFRNGDLSRIEIGHSRTPPGST